MVGDRVGSNVGVALGLNVGVDVGFLEGFVVVGDHVGLVVGERVGSLEGEKVGSGGIVGSSVGISPFTKELQYNINKIKLGTKFIRENKGYKQ